VNSARILSGFSTTERVLQSCFCCQGEKDQAPLSTTNPVSTTLCSKKTELLAEYVAALNLHSLHVNEYSNTVRAGLDGDLIETVRSRMQESREQTALARKRYSAHLEEHRCNLPIS
jgi:hypothetical protein